MAEPENDCPGGINHQSKSEWLATHAGDTAYLQKVHDRVVPGVTRCESPSCDVRDGESQKGAHLASWVARLSMRPASITDETIRENLLNDSEVSSEMVELTTTTGVAFCGCCIGQTLFMEASGLFGPIAFPIIVQPMFETFDIEREQCGERCHEVTQKWANKLKQFSDNPLSGLLALAIDKMLSKTTNRPTRNGDTIDTGIVAISGEDAKALEQAIESKDKETIAKIVGGAIADKLTVQPLAKPKKETQKRLPPIQTDEALDLMRMLDEAVGLPFDISNIRLDN